MSSSPDRLLAARRYVDEFPELRLVHDLAPAGADNLWSFAVDATVDVPVDSSLPPTTRWRIVLAATYPWGLLEAFLDAEQGVTLTFPHQHCNLPPCCQDRLWQRGLICVRSPNFAFNRRHLDTEPTGSVERMRWFLGRVIAWLNAAARGALVANGDPFELPDFAPEGRTVVWSESEESLSVWLTKMPQFGLADICHVCGSEHDGVFAIQAFRDARDQELIRIPWGTLVAEKRTFEKAVWIRLPCSPYLRPYQAPLTWGDMRECFREMRLPFDGMLRRALQPIRDGLQHLAIFGFPIPEKVGGDAAIMHWQACMLPILAYGVITRPGFRNNAVGYWRQDCFESFRPPERIKWCESRNWHVDQITGRGALREVVRTKRIGIIGAGAVGSVLAELLVRAGLLCLEVVDNDAFEAGNLVRHTLTMDDVGSNKANALAERLRKLSPHVSVVSTIAAFPLVSNTARDRLVACDLLIDCSASDEVAHALGSAPWNETGLRASISLGFAAKRCYVYLATAHRFDLGDLQSKASKWFEADARELASADLPAEAVGCWHPLFPARIDGVWSMTSLAVGEIERVVREPPVEPILVVYEKTQNTNGEIVIVRRTV